MKNLFIATMLLVSIQTASSPAQASFYSGDEIYRYCQEPRDTRVVTIASFAACRAYIGSLVDVFRRIDAAGIGESGLCIPAATTLDELVTVVQFQFSIYAELRDSVNGEKAIYSALKQVWSCP